MDRQMRMLIAATCVAIITAVGYFFWGEWSEARAVASAQAASAQVADEERRMKEDELRRSLSAAPEQAETLQGFCGLLRDGKAELRGSTLAQVDTTRRLLGYCRDLGHLS